MNSEKQMRLLHNTKNLMMISASSWKKWKRLIEIRLRRKMTPMQISLLKAKR
jgi:hypothetical protein